MHTRHTIQKPYDWHFSDKKNISCISISLSLSVFLLFSYPFCHIKYRIFVTITQTVYQFKLNSRFLSNIIANLSKLLRQYIFMFHKCQSSMILFPIITSGVLPNIRIDETNTWQYKNNLSISRNFLYNIRNIYI